MLKVQVNQGARVDILTVGHEQTPVMVIEDLCERPEQLIEFATDGGFGFNPGDFYPGVRKPLPESYINAICGAYLPLIKRVFQLSPAGSAEPILSSLSMAVTPPERLRPIQTLPHFDSPDRNQLAVVHYLCDERHGGTSFYRHRTTGFETIDAQRLGGYGALLKQQAIDSQLHQNPSYIDGDNPLFERIGQIEAKMNRAIIYPSHILHSGDIQPQWGLSSDPRAGRLTTSTFIRVT